MVFLTLFLSHRIKEKPLPSLVCFQEEICQFYDSLNLISSILVTWPLKGVRNPAQLRKIDQRSSEGLNPGQKLQEKQIKVAGTVFLDPQICQAGFTGTKLPDNTIAEAQVKKTNTSIFPGQE